MGSTVCTGEVGARSHVVHSLISLIGEGRHGRLNTGALDNRTTAVTADNLVECGTVTPRYTIGDLLAYKRRCQQVGIIYIFG
jgi:hypothetical protein